MLQVLRYKNLGYSCEFQNPHKWTADRTEGAGRAMDDVSSSSSSWLMTIASLMEVASRAPGIAEELAVYFSEQSYELTAAAAAWTGPALHPAAPALFALVGERQSQPPTARGSHEHWVRAYRDTRG